MQLRGAMVHPAPGPAPPHRTATVSNQAPINGIVVRKL